MVYAVFLTIFSVVSFLFMCFCNFYANRGVKCGWGDILAGVWPVCGAALCYHSVYSHTNPSHALMLSAVGFSLYNTSETASPATKPVAATLMVCAFVLSFANPF